MDGKDYIERAEIIRKNRFMSRFDLAYETKIHPQTFINIMKKPESCSLTTLQKLRAFVLKWENNNMSVSD
jgi:hypothetical protein